MKRLFRRLVQALAAVLEASGTAHAYSIGRVPPLGVALPPLPQYQNSTADPPVPRTERA